MMNLSVSVWFSIPSVVLFHFATYAMASCDNAVLFSDTMRNEAERELLSSAFEDCTSYNGGCNLPASITGSCQIVVRDCNKEIFQADDISSLTSWDDNDRPIVKVIVDKNSGTFTTFNVGNVFPGGYVIISEDSTVEKVTFGSIAGGSILAKGADAFGSKVISHDEFKGKLAVKSANVKEVSYAYINMSGNEGKTTKVHIGSVHDSGVVTIEEDSNIGKLTFDEIHSYGRIVAPGVSTSGKKVYNDGCLAARNYVKDLVTIDGGVATTDESECPSRQAAENTCGYEKGCYWDSISDDCTLTVRECYDDTFTIGSISGGGKLIVDQHSGHMEALVTGAVAENSEVVINGHRHLVSASFDSVEKNSKILIKGNTNLESVSAGSAIAGSEVIITDNKKLQSVAPASLLEGNMEAVIGTRVAYDESTSEDKRRLLRKST